MRRIYFLILLLLLSLLFFFLFRNIVKTLKDREMIMRKLETPHRSKTDTLAFSLKRGETFHSLLSRIPYLTDSQRANIFLTLTRAGLNFRTLKTGETLLLYLKHSPNQTLSKIDYKKNPETIYRLSLDSSGITLASVYQKRETKLEVVRDSISSSLYQSLLKISKSPELAINYAEIFEWDIDFFSEVQKGDSFFFLVEKKYADDKFIGYGRILLSIYKGKVGNFYGVWFQGDYYNLAGIALKKAFLKSPLRYSYIASRFSKRRYHPILRIVRPHRGVDYAAPTGTPVAALGDGVVTFSGWKGGYGKLVVIRHPNNYVTKYGHLSRIKTRIRPGYRVRQGEIIGYVGRTGLATGPHLHFEVLVGNSWVNPLKLSAPPKGPVPAELRPQFIALRDSLLQLISNINPEINPK